MIGSILAGVMAAYHEMELEKEITKNMTEAQKKERAARRLRYREVEALERIARKKWSIF